MPDAPTDDVRSGPPRRVVANISLSLDGRTHGPAGETDMGWIVPHAVSDGARDHMVRVTGAASTALLGRKNFEGFAGFWPSVADDPEADDRDRAFSRWFVDVEKIVVSTTLAAAGTSGRLLEHTTPTASSPAEVVSGLRDTPGEDIVVLASSSVIRDLLAADLVDRLSITLCPETVGGGARLFDDAPPSSGSWTLTDHTATSTGALCLLYDRAR